MKFPSIKICPICKDKSLIAKLKNALIKSTYKGYTYYLQCGCLRINNYNQWIEFQLNNYLIYNYFDEKTNYTNNTYYDNVETNICNYLNDYVIDYEDW